MARVFDLTVERIQAITIDADVGRPGVGYTEEEKAFRAQVEIELAEIHAKGGSLDFGPGEIEV
jgi:hypothetical protein